MRIKGAIDAVEQLELKGAHAVGETTGWTTLEVCFFRRFHAAFQVAVFSRLLFQCGGDFGCPSFHPIYRPMRALHLPFESISRVVGVAYSL